MLKPRSVMTEVLNCRLEVSEFELQSWYDDRFLTNTLRRGINLLIYPSEVSKSTITVLLFGLMSRMFVNGLGDRGSIRGRVIPRTQKKQTKKNLMPSCLTLSIIRYGSRIKWSNPGNGVARFPTPWCSSYWKWSYRVTLNCYRQIYLQGWLWY